MPTIDSRIRLLTPGRGSPPTLAGMWQILRPVWKYGDILELRDLARALLATCRCEGYLCALETMEHAFPGESIRPDDEVEVFALRAARFGPPPTVLKGMPRAFRLASDRQRCDLLLLGAASDTKTGFSLLLDRLSGKEDLAPLAARLLLWRAMELQNSNGPGRVLLGATLSDAAANLTELPRELLLALVVHLTGCPGTDGGLTISADGPVMESLIRLVRAADEPIVRERLLALLRFDAFSRSALDGLESLRLGRIDGVLERSGHLMRDPKRARMLSGSRFPARVAGRLSRARPMEDERSQHLPGLLAGSSLSRELVTRRLSEIALDTAPLAAVLATQTLIERKLDDSSCSALETIHRESPVAEAATLAGVVLAEPTDSSDVGGLRAFEEALGDAPGWWCATLALFQLEADPIAARAVIRRALLGPDQGTRARAIEVIDRRGLVAEFESNLIDVIVGFDAQVRGELGGSGDPTIPAQAVRLLAMGPTPRSAREIVRRLASACPALQAAAIMAASNPKASPAVREGCSLVDVELLERLAEANEPQVRAAALRALRLRSRQRSDEMTRRLLDHQSPEFRLTGLEGVRQFADPDLRASVLRLIEREEHQELVMRGRSVLRFLDGRRALPLERREEALA